MTNPTVFHPKIVHFEKLFPEPLRPEEIRVTFECRNDVVVVDLGEHPLFLGPDSGAVGPLGFPDAGVEEVAPVSSVVAPQGVEVVLDVEQAAGFAAVDDFVEGVGLGGAGGSVERDVSGGEGIRGGGALETCVVADGVLGSARLDDGLDRCGGVVSVCGGGA